VTYRIYFSVSPPPLPLYTLSYMNIHSTHPCIHTPTHPHNHPPTYTHTPLPPRTYLHPPTHPTTHQPTHASTYPFTYTPTHPPTHPHTHTHSARESPALQASSAGAATPQRKPAQQKQATSVPKALPRELVCHHSRATLLLAATLWRSLAPPRPASTVQDIQRRATATRIALLVPTA